MSVSPKPIHPSSHRARRARGLRYLSPLVAAIVAGMAGVSGCTAEGVIGTVTGSGPSSWLAGSDAGVGGSVGLSGAGGAAQGSGGNGGLGGSGAGGAGGNAGAGIDDSGSAGANTDSGAAGSTGVGGSSADNDAGDKGTSIDAGGLIDGAGLADGSGGTVDDLILKYDFEDGAGTMITDSSTNARHGVLSDGVWGMQGRNGGGVSFAAADTSVAIPHGQLANVHQLTIAAWVNLTANAADNRLFYFGVGADAYLSLALNDSNAGMSLRFKTAGGTEQVVTSATQLPIGVWKHVAIALSSGGTSIYVDGKVIMQSALVIDPATLGTTTDDFVGNAFGGAEPLQGVIDEFYMYQRALTTADIATLAWPKTDYSMFHFDEGTGTATADSSDRAKSGTLMNNASWVPGVFGNAVHLDNPVTPPAVQYVDLADGIISDCGANLTIAGWLNLDSLTDNARFVDFGNDIDHYVYVVPRYTGSNVLRFSLKNLSANNRASGVGFAWTTSRWYHIAIVRQAAVVSLYVDGVLLTGNPSLSTGFAVNGFGATVNNYFGKSQDDTMAGLDAAIDEILISCRAYTGDEIKQLAYKP
ncbi:MAG TPA: LamG domain-containing protein [Polyangiaceae bacterium]